MTIMEIIVRKYLRCPACGFERQVQDQHLDDPRCPCCINPAIWSKWAQESQAKPVEFEEGTK